MDDFIDERELYHLSSSLVNFLTSWRSDKGIFFDRILQLSNDMVDKDFWRPNDALLVQYWLEDLISIGYKPPMVSEGDGLCDSPSVTVNSVEQPSSYLGLKDKLKQIL